MTCTSEILSANLTLRVMRAGFGTRERAFPTMQDLTKPPQGSVYRLLTPDRFGFGTSEKTSVVIVDWTLNEGAHAEFSPIRIIRKEIHKRYGIFENYAWQDKPKANEES